MVLVDRLKADEVDPGVVAAHEIGHVMGLRHPFEPDCGGGSAPVGEANIMAIERDLTDGRLVLRSASLRTLQLTAFQVATMRAS